MAGPPSPLDLPLHPDLNAVEVFFAKLTRRRLIRGVFRFVDDLKPLRCPARERIDRACRSGRRTRTSAAAVEELIPLETILLAHPEAWTEEHVLFMAGVRSKLPRIVPMLSPM
jgi:hypothetical protein